MDGLTAYPERPFANIVNCVKLTVGCAAITFIFNRIINGCEVRLNSNGNDIVVAYCQAKCSDTVISQ